MSSLPEIVTLKNGEKAPSSFVVAMMLVLDNLFKEKPVIFYEAAMCARDRNHKPFGKIGDDLVGLSILSEDGSMHSLTRSVILSAIEGKDFDLFLVSPVAK